MYTIRKITQYLTYDSSCQADIEPGAPEYSLTAILTFPVLQYKVATALSEQHAERWRSENMGGKHLNYGMLIQH